MPEDRRVLERVVAKEGWYEDMAFKDPLRDQLSMAYDEVERCKQGPRNINLSISRLLLSH